jgi:predicted CXXCH cytochrome family protein
MNRVTAIAVGIGSTSHKLLVSGLLATLLLSASMTGSAEEACLGCHQFGADSPAHDMPADTSTHADVECDSCHGVSTTHTERPTMAAPDISFGPRWSANVGDQDSQCLECHDDVAEDWEDALHMANKLTCVTCHDMHKTKDRILNPHTQGEVCTVCHKVQKEGIHGIEELSEDNPVCTTCHNPHGDQSPVGRMLANRSEGCRTCHNLLAMRDESSVSDKAKSYHKVMAQKDRTCIDCHTGVAHGAAGAVDPFIPLAVPSANVTLFYPAQSDIDWILSEHPGSQPFRQGTNCQQCHRGEEASMGAALGSAKPTSLELEVGFREQNGQLLVNLSWQGKSDDEDISLMWGNDGNAAFRRGGCWAACHSDMPGMSRDRGLELGKYLADSRVQQQRIGQPPLVKDSDALEQMMQAGNFVEMWRVKLNKGNASASTATLLSGLTWSDNSNLAAKASFVNGQWNVELSRALNGSTGQKTFENGQSYTFGMALHSANRSGAQHWVSLPMTLGLDRDDTDFRVD